MPYADQNVGAKKPYLQAHITGIDDIEAMTGIDFLITLKEEEPNKERAIERHKAKKLWATE